MFFLLILFLLTAYLIMEAILHERRLKRIPLRIHVNGTRGKSSVVRLIAASLREAGIKALAKTTGTNPMLIFPDGHEEMISRRGPSRIQEQMRFIKKAAKMDVGAIVVECMAIDPQLQFVSEVKMIRSTIGIITNVRQDHLEVMGKSLDHIAESLSQSIPRDGILVTADRHYFNYFKSQAAKRNTIAYLAEETGFNSNQEQNLPSIYKDNLLIGEKICSLLDGMILTVPDPMIERVLEKDPVRVQKLKNSNRAIYFIDAFSANDIDSTKIIQKQILDGKDCPRPFIALLNNRSDRPLRMLSFASFLSQETEYDYIMLIGDNRRLAKRYIRRLGMEGNIIALKSREPQTLINEIFQKVSSPECTVVGMGNYKGPGEALSLFFQGKR
jgi:poly-gamma-glutamate synthase PgsB/CapB